MINSPFAEEGIVECQWCHSGEWLENKDGDRNNFCGQCGNKIDWPEEDGDKRWRKVSNEIPYMSSSVMCSDDVEVKFDDGHISVGFVAFTGQWFNHDCDEIKKPAYWRPLQNND